MNKKLTVALLVYLWLIAGFGQAIFAQTKNKRDEQKLIQLEKDWSASFLKNDTSAIALILADEFVGIDGRGFVSDKAAELKEAAGTKSNEPEPPFVIINETFSEFKVRFFGKIAVVNSLNAEKIKTKEKELVIKFRRTTVWIKRDGRWQCVSFHASRLLES